MCSNIDKLERVQEKEFQSDEIKNLAAESLEILAPIADLLGMWRLRWKLEDYSFKILYPNEYNKISRRFNIDEKKNRDKYIQKTIHIVQKAAEEKNINCTISGRFKHYYSIYQKMKFKKKSFNEILDVFALRVIVDSVDDCYRMLGIIHRLWAPKHRRIKDYIGAPKNNNYRTLHTTVFGVNGKLTEFQIRTKEMDQEAKFGIAAHYSYKNKVSKNPDWIKELLLKQQQYTDEEFLNNFSSDLLTKRIFVYSPKGDVISLPEESTPIDFAYQIHTELGNKCSGAIVNDLPVALNHKLVTNDIVEIITDRQQIGPSSDWLNFVKTKTAKKQINDYFEKLPN
jgi:GTP pyrophosphokinase